MRVGAWVNGLVMGWVHEMNGRVAAAICIYSAEGVDWEAWGDGCWLKCVDGVGHLPGV